MKPYLSPKKFRILAHRGSTEGGALENTIQAFEFAEGAGITYVETDIQATSDGVAVVFHDRDLLRTFGIDKKVAQVSFEELNAISQLSGVEIPTLDTVLLKFPNLRFNVDFKSEKSVAPGMKAINSFAAQGAVLVASFSLGRRLKAIEESKGIATSADAITLIGLWVTWKLGFKAAFAKLCKAIDALQIPEHFGPLRFANSEFIEAVNRCGVEVHFWTINDFEQANRLRVLGANGIVTDKSKMMIDMFAAAKIEII